MGNRLVNKIVIFGAGNHGTFAWIECINASTNAPKNDLIQWGYVVREVRVAQSCKGKQTEEFDPAVSIFYNNVYAHQLSYHFVWTENGKFEVKAMHKWIGKYMNGEMTPYERDSGKLEWWELLYSCWLTVTARCIAEANANPQRRASSAASTGHIALLNMQWLRAALTMYFALSFS